MYKQYNNNYGQKISSIYQCINNIIININGQKISSIYSVLHVCYMYIITNNDTCTMYNRMTRLSIDVSYCTHPYPFNH